MKQCYYYGLFLVTLLFCGCSGDVLDGASTVLDPHKPALVGQAQAFMAGVGTDRLSLPNMAYGMAVQAAKDKKGRTFQQALQKGLTGDIQVNWNQYQLLDQDGQEIVLFPLKHTSIAVVSYLSVDGISRKSASHLRSKLLVKKCEDGNFAAFVVSYLPDKKYLNAHPQGTDDLGIEFWDTGYSGYYLLSTLEGKLVYGARFEEGRRVFKFFRTCDLLPGPSDGDTVHQHAHSRYHLALNFVSGTKALRALAPDTNKENNGTYYCSFCHKPWEQCTCVTVEPEPETEYCKECNSYIHNGRCNCCPVCKKYVCICSSGGDQGGGNTGGGNTGGNNGGNNGGNSGGPIGGNTDGGGGKPPVTSGHKVDTAKITAALPGVRAAVIKQMGMKKAACNIGVKEAFKAIIGPLPKGMDVQATQMVAYWKNNPDKWQPIKMSEAQKLANEGYFVVAGWQNPNPQESGHVVLVVPGEEVGGSNWAPKIPVVLDMGFKRREIKYPINNSFGKKKRANVLFFYYK